MKESEAERVTSTARVRGLTSSCTAVESATGRTTSAAAALESGWVSSMVSPASVASTA